MIRYGLIAAALMLPSVAHAQDWRLASVEDDAESVFFIDADSLSAPGANVRGTIFMVLTKSENGVTALHAKLEFECATGRRRILSIGAYDQQEQLARSSDNEGAWEPNEPNTQFSLVWEMMCRKKPLSARSYGAAPPFAAAREVRESR